MVVEQEHTDNHVPHPAKFAAKTPAAPVTWVTSGGSIAVAPGNARRAQMDDTEWLADPFEEHRGHLRAVAYQMLGSLTEADDAVQDAWLRVSRAGAAEIDNLGGWLTTV